MAIYAEAEANHTLNEVGLFNGVNLAGSALYARKTFGDIVKTANFILTVNWDIEF